ncbi:MAG TPA: DUF2231 domain-containing protein [Candidatus Paceibacterota bacterium]
MNIHPLIVHFPVALLFIYSILEIARFKLIKNIAQIFYIKASFVIIGAVMSYAAFITGNIAKGLVPSSGINNILLSHERFAKLTIFIFSVAAIGYLIRWTLEISFEKIPQNFRNFLTSISNVILSPFVSVALALMGLITLSITGILGGTMVYGPTTDPFAGFLYPFFK